MTLQKQKSFFKNKIPRSFSMPIWVGRVKSLRRLISEPKAGGQVGVETLY